MFKKLSEKYQELCQEAAANQSSKSSKQVQMGLVVLGVALLSTGLTLEAMAAGGGGAGYTAQANYNDHRIAESADVVISYLNGAFGALVMVASGIGAIISGAFGQYRAALGLMVVAIGSFIVRSLISTFFNDVSMAIK